MIIKMLFIVTMLLISATTFYCDNHPTANNADPVVTRNVTWIASGCMKQDSLPIGKTAKRQISVLQTDSGTSIVVPITTYCSTEFKCTDVLIKDTMELTIKNTTVDKAFCICDYNINFLLSKEAAITWTRIILDVYSDVHPLCTLTVIPTEL